MKNKNERKKEMPFEKKMKEEIEKYARGHLPNEGWYSEKFYPFIRDTRLRERLIIEFENARIIYKIFEGLQAEGALLLAQIKTQVVMYVSIQEAVINYVLFDLYSNSKFVQELRQQERLKAISIPKKSMEKLKKELKHSGKNILTYYLEKKTIDVTKIRYEQKVETVYKLGLISEKLKKDLIKLYTYRNTVHIEAELKKNLSYDLDMGELAYRRVEGLSIELTQSLTD